ncbi:hypothetical protein MHYP_G00146610 [Metynnis hypsauchen]
MNSASANAPPTKRSSPVLEMGKGFEKRCYLYPKGQNRKGSTRPLLKPRPGRGGLRGRAPRLLGAGSGGVKGDERGAPALGLAKECCSTSRLLTIQRSAPHATSLAFQLPPASQTCGTCYSMLCFAGGQATHVHPSSAPIMPPVCCSPQGWICRTNRPTPIPARILEIEQNQAVIRQIKVEGKKMLQMEREIRVGVGWSERGKDDEKDVEVPPSWTVEVMCKITIRDGVLEEQGTAEKEKAVSVLHSGNQGRFQTADHTGVHTELREAQPNLFVCWLYDIFECCISDVILDSCAFTWFERISIMVILLNCVTLGMYQPCENIDCTSDRCQILQDALDRLCEDRVDRVKNGLY